MAERRGSTRTRVCHFSGHMKGTRSLKMKCCFCLVQIAWVDLTLLIGLTLTVDRDEQVEAKATVAGELKISDGSAQHIIHEVLQ